MGWAGRGPGCTGPRRVAPREPDHAVQPRCVVGDLDHGTEEALARCLLTGARELRNEAVHDLKQRRIAIVGLSAGPGDVPTVDSRARPGPRDRATSPGSLSPPARVVPCHAAGSRHASARAARSPWDPSSPVVAEPRRVARRTLRPGVCSVLGRCCGEGERQLAHVIHQVAQGVRRTRREGGDGDTATPIRLRHLISTFSGSVFIPARGLTWSSTTEPTISAREPTLPRRSSIVQTDMHARPPKLGHLMSSAGRSGAARLLNVQSRGWC